MIAVTKSLMCDGCGSAYPESTADLIAKCPPGSSTVYELRMAAKRRGWKQEGNWRTRARVRDLCPRCAEEKLAAGRMEVLLALYHAEHGLTDHEQEAFTGLQQDSGGKRRGELCAAGLAERLVVDGLGLTRPSPRGKPAAVWTLTAAGRRLVEEHPT